jgi:drug/metabolite transporter (DMT)-like permease
VLFGITYAVGRPMERPPLDPESLSWIVPWFAGLSVISYLGQYGGTKFIPEWIDLGVVAVFSLVICYLAVVRSLSSDRVAAAIAADEHEAAVQPELKTA